jgi:hypothetical protein
MLTATGRDIHPFEEEVHSLKSFQVFHFILVKISTCSLLQSGISILLRKKFIPQNLFKFMTVLQDKVIRNPLLTKQRTTRQSSKNNVYV